MDQHSDFDKMKERKLRCKKCKNVWVTNSRKKRWVTCSNRNCKHKVDAEKYLVR